jgi:WD40 repeat protein
MRPRSFNRPIGIVPILVASVGLAAALAQAQQTLFVASEDYLRPSYVGAYDAATGATINANFIPAPAAGSGAHALALDGNNHLFITASLNGSVGVFDATTGATINATLVNGQGLDNPESVALDGNNHLLVGSFRGIQGTATVGKYDATTGATIDASFISGLSDPRHVVFDGHNRLFVADIITNASSVRVYDSTTGVQTGLLPFGSNDLPFALAVDGLTDRLFVAHGYPITGSNPVSEYDATTLAVINPSFIIAASPSVMALDGRNHLFIASYGAALITEFDETTGALIHSFPVNSVFAYVKGLVIAAPASCYANCDGSAAAPVLNVNDFVCFQNRFAAGDSYANCDGSTVTPILNVNDFSCFLNRFAAGCP